MVKLHTYESFVPKNLDQRQEKLRLIKEKELDETNKLASELIAITSRLKHFKVDDRAEQFLIDKFKDCQIMVDQETPDNSQIIFFFDKHGEYLADYDLKDKKFWLANTNLVAEIEAYHSFDYHHLMRLIKNWIEEYFKLKPIKTGISWGRWPANLMKLYFLNESIHTLKEAFDISNLTLIATGSVSEVYSDGTFAYRVTSTFNSPNLEDIKKNINQPYKNVVHIYDAWTDEDDTVIKMELLTPIKEVFKGNEKELSRIDSELWEMQDEVVRVEGLEDETTDPQIKQMLQAILNGAKELKTDTLDLGFHNLMYDAKTDEYKLIDIF